LAECTLSHVESLVKRGFAGEVVLLNVVNVDIPWTEIYEYADDKKIFDINVLRKQLLDASGKYLTKKASELISKGINVKMKALEANRPAQTIIDYAQKNKMDLIVMATHGFKKLMLGSVAFGVLHESHIPVLLIRPESCRT
jgi:nucleotide-binding universal stress UspA family protein